MKKSILSLFVALTFLIASCTSNKKIEPDDEFAVEANAGSSSGSDLDKDLSLDGDLSSDKPAANTPPSTDTNQDLALENELNSLGDDNAPAPQQPPVATNSQQDELSLDEPAAPAPVPVAPAPAPVEPAPVVINEPVPPVDTPPPVVETAPMPETPAPVVESAPVELATIDNVSYKANANGGTVEIGANRPLEFTTRLNSATNQLIVEVKNSVLPKKLKRSLNTKDMASSIGSVDIYQKAGSNVARFVIQLREGASEPIVQPEGNSLLVVGGIPANASFNSAANSQVSYIDGKAVGRPNEEIVDLRSEGIMSSDNLEEFLISNNKFYGKKISIETNGIDVKDAIRFLAEESGVNIIMDEGIDGKVSLKLKGIPWDQAFVLILKSKKLAFKRQGTVLRVAKMEDIKKDEDLAIEMQEARKSKEPIVVKRFFIGYANIDELETKISKFLSSTLEAQKSGTGTAGTAAATAAKENVGKVLSDKRTNSLIVTDTESNMARIEKLINALDTQPMQVLIEGKVVEAKEEFTRGLGIFWNSVPSTTSANSAKVGINPALDPGFAVLDTTLTWGQLDVLGSLSAQLQLGEREDKARVLSSPRISVLSSEKATISQTAGILIPKARETASGGSSSVTTFEVVNVGVTLDVTPQVSNEGTVTMDLSIQRSFLPTVDSVAPDIRNAKTKVIVKSGQTAVIGGIFESETRTGTSGVPMLKDIPILGRLFKGDRDAKSKNELVIFVTPNILKPVAGGEKKMGELQ